MSTVRSRSAHGPRRVVLYPKSMYNTTFRNEFKPKRQEGVVRRNYEPFQPNTCPMETTTTNQQTYKGYAIERKAVAEDVPFTSYIKLMAQTSYGQDFPSYGAVGQLIQKTPQHPYRGRMASIDARTTYGTSYYGNQSEKRASAIDLWASDNVINPKTEHEFTSTATAFHTHQWDSRSVNNRVYREKEIYTPAAYSSVHFKTEAQDHFRGGTAPAKENPRLMRKLETGVKSKKISA